jgi:hypothetical protein
MRHKVIKADKGNFFLKKIEYLEKLELVIKSSSCNLNFIEIVVSEKHRYYILIVIHHRDQKLF